MDTDPRAIQQVVFEGVVGGNNDTKKKQPKEQSKETTLQFSKGTAKVL